MKQFLKMSGISNLFDCKTSADSESKEAKRMSGFTLLETAIALVIILVGLLGVFVVISYAISYNTGNNTRSQALAVLQQEVEALRSAKFTPSRTDDNAPPLPDCRTDGLRDLTGGKKARCMVTVTDNGDFFVETAIDDDPTDTDRCTLEDGDPCTVKPTANFKEITVRVTPVASGDGWVNAVPATAVFRRVRSN